MTNEEIRLYNCMATGFTFLMMVISAVLAFG